MAVKRSTGETAGTAKKSTAKGGTAKQATTKKAAGAGSTGTATKKATAKKAAGPKLSDAQQNMLRRVADAGEAGHRADKKPENKTLETLLKHKLVKRGKKDQASGNYNYAISKTGQKHLETLGSSGAAGSTGASTGASGPKGS